MQSSIEQHSIYGVPDEENPEWTKEDFKRSKRLHEMPAEFQQAVAHAMGRKTRGPQKSPLKQRTSIRLSPEVMAALRATGPGWQARAEEALRKAFVR
ncbi:BrnA antitoxin family protein [Terriglobus sp.]|uniref:BrnA antitoxin family protein n=1 Tax=Terriglobus sp. TaxID=1889013 RepID=UPI003B00306E